MKTRFIDQPVWAIRNTLLRRSMTVLLAPFAVVACIIIATVDGFIYGLETSWWGCMLWWKGP